MRKRVLSLLLSVCMVLVLFPTVSSAYGNYTVEGRTATLIANDADSLQSALNDSCVDEVVIGAAITLPNETILDGGGKTVRVPSPYVNEDGTVNSSASSFRVFNVKNGSTVSISNMTIMGGYVSSDGGGIASYGNITLENVTFTRSNRGLMEYEGKAVLKNCNFVMNICDSAGAIWCGGGAKVVLDGCSFTNNHSSGGGSKGGGAIGVSGGSTNLFANNTVLANNATNEIGGAINLYRGNAYLINCTFTGNVTNSSVTYGGAIGNNSGNLYAANCIFVDNYASITGSLERSDVDNYNSANSVLYNCLYGTTNGAIITAAECKTDTGNETAFSYVDTGVTLRDGSTSVSFTHPDLASGTNAYAKYVPVNATGPAITGGIATYFDYSDLSAIKMGYGAPESITAFSGLTAPDSSKKVTTYFEGCIRSDGVIGASAPKNPAPAKYTVTWKSQDGSSTLETDTAVEYGATPSFDGSAPTKAADANYTYTFEGWATSPNQEIGTAAASLPNVTGDVTYYAAFSKTVNKYTVTFDANGGSVTPTSAETGTDGKLATLPTPTHSGSYSFDGWYTMKEGGTKVDTNTVFTAAATIYAHWSRSFSFADLPETGVTNITVPEGDYYTGVAAKDAFILYWDENIKTDGNFILIDYFYTYNNGYHSWMITIENGVAEAVDGGFMEYYTTLDLINNLTSYDCWINGTYTADTAVTEYDVWVGGTQVTNDNKNDIFGNGTVSFNTDTNTLTLNNATLTESYEYEPYYESVIYSALPSLTVNLTGTNEIAPTSTYSDGIDAAGGCNITVTGNGTLNITNGYYGFYVGSYDVPGGNLTIDGATLNVSGTLAAGIWVNHDISFTDSTVRVIVTNDFYTGLVSNIDGTITVTNSDIQVSAIKAAIHMGNTDASNHRLVFNSGTLTISSSDGYGIYVEPDGSTGNINGALTINGGTLSIQSASGATNIPLTAVTIASDCDVITGNDLHSTGSVVVAPITSYDLYVGGVQVTSANAANVLAGDAANDGKVSYDADTNTLTLDGADISDGVKKIGYRSERSYTDLIYAKNIGDLTVKVVSDSTLHRDQTDSWTSPRGIALYDDNGATLTVDLQNGATLSMPITTTAQQAYYVTAFALSGYDLTVKGNGNLNINLSASDSSTASAGIKILDNTAHTFSIEDSTNVEVFSNHSLMLNAAGIQSSESKLSLSVSENANLTVKACTGLSNVDATVNGTMDISPIKSALDYNILRALSDSSVTAGEGKAVYAGKNAENAAKQASPWTGFSGATENNCYVAVKAPATYTVTVTPGANMTKISGEESQTVEQGEAITDVVYTADTGCFPDTYSIETVNGITVTRNSATQITVSGTPTAAANITLTAPSEHQAGEATSENEVSATCTEQGSYDNVTYCKYCGVELSRDTKYTDPLGHNWDNGVITTQPTETTEGIKTFTCSRCGETRTESVPVLAHTHSYTAVVTKPTCTEKGYTTYTCACGDSYVANYVDALGHDFADGTCSRCGAEDPNYKPIDPGKPCDGGASCPGKSFTDMPKPNNWAHAGIDFCVENGLFGGMSKTTFEPEGNMTRAMLVTVLYRLEGQPAVTASNPFSDVANGQWYTNAVVWAAGNGVVNGVGDGKFDPDANITREQMAAILYRYAQKKGFDTSARADLKTYPDYGEISAYARDALSWANVNGLINGTDGTNGQTILDPQGNATRAQVAAILMRYVKNISKT